MPYKDKENVVKAMREYRERKKGITERDNEMVGITDIGITQGITQYHPILDDLVDPIRRKKLEAVCLALKRRNLQGKVFYGVGKNGLPMNVVGDLLDATEAK